MLNKVVEITEKKARQELLNAKKELLFAVPDSKIDFNVELTQSSIADLCHEIRKEVIEKLGYDNSQKHLDIIFKFTAYAIRHSQNLEFINEIETNSKSKNEFGITNGSIFRDGNLTLLTVKNTKKKIYVVELKDDLTIENRNYIMNLISKSSDCISMKYRDFKKVENI